MVNKGQIKPYADWLAIKISSFKYFPTVMAKKTEFVCSFFGRIYGAPICFWFYLTFSSLTGIKMSHRNWVFFMQNFLAKAICGNTFRKRKRPESLKSTAFLLLDFWVNKGPDQLTRCLGDPTNPNKVIWFFFENLNHLKLKYLWLNSD